MPQTMDDAPQTTSKRSREDDIATAWPDAKGNELIRQTVTINRPRAELFEYWRDFSNLASFMDNVERVDLVSEVRSHWVVKAPAGKTVEWDAIITEVVEGKKIAWTSAEGADVPNSGRVEFRDAQGNRGTIVSATILYDPPGGVVGKIVAKLFQREPAIQARRDLRRFKQLMEAGEVATAARTSTQLAQEKE